MLYDINGKAVNIIVKDEQVKLPESLRRKILENFENMRRSGANIWNGNLLHRFLPNYRYHLYNHLL